jgi:RND family efflux transporter MFP subunit
MQGVRRAAFGVLAAVICNSALAAVETSPANSALQTQVVRVKSRMAFEEVVGTVRPRLSASLSAKTSGVIEQMLVVPGQRVKAGELLIQIDAREAQARLDQAQALLEQTSKDITRNESLLKSKAISQQEFDAAQARYRVAEATQTEAKTQLGHCRITAPFDGVITAKRADIGDLAEPGKLLIDMEAPETLRIEADIPETLIDKIKPASRLSVQTAPGTPPIEAVVSEISPAADPGSRTFRVKLDLPPGSGLRSGQFGRVAVPTAEVTALRVPTKAVILRGQMELAFVIVDKHAQMRLVKTGKRLNDEVEILSGLDDGDLLAVTGIEHLKDGQTVE